MNKILELISNYKEQVKYKKMSDITISISSGLNPRQNFKLNTNDAKNYYVTVKEISSNKIVFSNKTDLVNDEALRIIQKRSKLEEGDVLLSGIGTLGKVALVDIPIDNWNCSESVLLIKPNKKEVTSKFLRYVLLSTSMQEAMINSSVGSTLKGIRKEWLNNLQIPIPPLEVQNKIVEILDKFTNYEAELEAELEYRNKQYKYYRDSLFSNLKDVEWRALREMCLLNKFKQLGAAELEKLKDKNGNIKLLPSSQNYDWFTSEEKAKKYICEGKVITLGRARHPNIKYVEGKFVSANNIIIQSKNENELSFKYLYYFINMKKQDFYIETSTYPKFDKNTFESFQIPIPPLEVQSKIVEILDKFSALVNDISDGIPIEIELRRKQYEYYRNKLLTFKIHN